MRGKVLRFLAGFVGFLSLIPGIVFLYLGFTPNINYLNLIGIMLFLISLITFFTPVVFLKARRRITKVIISFIFVLVPMGLLGFAAIILVNNIVLLGDVLLVFIGILLLSYAFTSKIMIEKPFFITSAIILLYYALFYHPSQLIDKIILLTGALISTNLASRRGVGGKFYMIIALILLFYFIYNFITTLTLLPIIGTSLSFLLLLLSNRSNRLPFISYITFPLGISIIMYSFSSINPLVINFVQLIFGVLLIL
ncbi:MAG: hypothetical protein QW685_07055, partial [Saccharolobus sp.]